MTELLISKGDRVTVTVGSKTSRFVAANNFWDYNTTLELTPAFNYPDHDAWGWATYDALKKPDAGVVLPMENPYPLNDADEKVFGRFLLESNDQGIPCFQPVGEDQWVVDADRLTAFEEVVIVPVEKFNKYGRGSFSLVNSVINPKN